ncbi:MAG: hypothetical protein JSS66_00675 [Armatimonadetes bacterium]|nr:hypothetical protein [Armatimonadota bacterium]
MKSSGLLVVLSLALVVSCNGAKTSANAPLASVKPVLLRLKEKPGTNYKYTYTVATFADPTHIKKGSKMLGAVKTYSRADLTGEVDVTVKDLKDGKYTYATVNKVLTSAGKGDWKQQAEEVLKNPPEKAEWQWDDRLHYVKKDTVLDPMTNTLNGMFPDKEVQSGSTWEYFPFEGGKLPVKAKLEGEDTVAGMKALKITLEVPATNEGDINTMSVWIDPSNGRYLQIHLKSASNQDGFNIENDFMQTIKK